MVKMTEAARWQFKAMAIALVEETAQTKKKAVMQRQEVEAEVYSGSRLVTARIRL